jgi:polyphosphate kinase
VLPAFLNDRVKARELQADGTYVRLKTEKGKKPSQAQLHFRERAREQGSDGGIKPLPATMATLVPQLQPPTPDVVQTAETPPAPSTKMQTS